MAQRDRQRGKQDAELAEQRRRIMEQQQLHRGGADGSNPAQPQRANPDQGGSQAGRQQHSRYREQEDRNRQRADRTRSDENPTGGQYMDPGQDRDAAEERLRRQRGGTPGLER